MKPTSERFLEKAEKFLRAAKRDLEANDTENAISRAYYAIFHAATAALHEKDLTVKSHRGTHDQFFRHYVQTGILDRHWSKILATLEDERMKVNYEIDLDFLISTAEDRGKRAEDFLNEIRSVLE